MTKNLFTAILAACLFISFSTGSALAQNFLGIAVFKNITIETERPSALKRHKRKPAHKKRQITAKEKALHKQALKYARKSKQNKPRTVPMEQLTLNYEKVPRSKRSSFKPITNVPPRKLQLMAYSNCFEKQAFKIKMKDLMISSYQTGGAVENTSDSFFDIFIDAGECRYNEAVSNKLIKIGKQCEKKWIMK